MSRTMTRRQLIAGMLASGVAATTAGLLTACGQQKAAATATATAASSEAAAASASTQDETAGGGHVLVAYFSAQGHTKAVAETAADALGADLFELVPANPYSDDDLNWRDDASRVNAEHNDTSLQDVELTQATPDGWDDYDAVLLGYPIWWGGAAWPLSGFVTGNGFAGKTVIPFCTSASSGLGDSASALEQEAGASTWLEGQRFASDASADEVTNWAQGLGL